MFKFFAKLYLGIFRWSYNEFPDVEKAILLMAPHTSMRDFFFGKVYCASQGFKPVVLIKKEAFFWPVGPILKRMGGVPVDRGRKTGLTQQSIDLFKNAKGSFYLVITPEGTRKKTKNWKKGFIRIALGANVSVVMGFLDCENRKMGVIDELDMNGTEAEIMERVKKKYLGLQGIHKDKFVTGYE